VSTRSGSGSIDLLDIREDYEHLRWLTLHFKRRRTSKNMKKSMCLQSYSHMAQEQLEHHSEEEAFDEVLQEDLADDNPLQHVMENERLNLS